MANTKTNFSKKKIASIILFVFTALWFLGAIGWYLIYKPISESDTNEYTAEITNIQPVPSYSITTDKHNSKFGIFFKDTVINMNDLNNLSVGQTITFRIKKSDTTRLNDSDDTIWLVSLKVDNTEIITIESYNQNNTKLQSQVTPGFAICGTIFLIIAILLLLWDKGKIGKNKNL